MGKNLNLRSNVALGLIFAFLANTFGPVPIVQAQEFVLPAPGKMVVLSPAYSPAVLKGIKLDPKNPFRFHFYVDKGDGDSLHLKQEATRLIKYFLASLTIPEKDLWVNLSPYEKDRIVPQEFGQTEMGRDLLAEDYLLKQITASLIYPESQLGKEFWAKVYAQAQAKYGTTNIPINTFNKVWIVPDKAVVYENGGTAFVLENHLKVMLEEDYLSLSKHQIQPTTSTFGSQIIREIVIPALTKEVNEGKNFSELRQVFYSLILATWYKKKIKDSILNKVYSNRKKTSHLSSPNALIGDPQHIYQQYLKAFKKGVYNYIKDTDIPHGVSVPRKYFSGGVVAGKITTVIDYEENINHVQLADLAQSSLIEVSGDTELIGPIDRAMHSQQERQIIQYLMSSEEHDIKQLADFGRSLGYESPDQFLAMVRHLSDKKMLRPDPDHFPDKWTSFQPTFYPDGSPTGKVKSYWAILREDYETHQNKWHKGAHVYVFSPDGELYLQIRSNGKLDISAGGGMEVGLDGKETGIKEVEEELHLAGIERSNLKPVLNTARQDGFKLDYSKIEEPYLDSAGVYHSQGDKVNERVIIEAFQLNLTPAQESDWMGKVSGHVLTWDDFLEGKQRILNEEVFGIVKVRPQKLLEFYSKKENRGRLAQGLKGMLAQESIRQMLSADEAMTIDQVKQIMDIAFSRQEWVNVASPKQDFPESVDQDLVASIWQPHFQQIINESGLSVDDFILKLQEGALSSGLTNRLKDPWSRVNVVSNGQDKFDIDEVQVKDQLKRRIRSLVGKHNEPGKLEIVLGGTLFTEVKIVLEMLNDVLKETAGELQIQDVDRWIQGWKIKVRALSIQTSYLVNINRELNEQKILHKEWVKLEYMDLLDPTQWERLSSQPADVFFVVNSLYLGEWEYNEGDKTRHYDEDPLQKIKLLEFVKHVPSFVKHRGVFITEWVTDNHGKETSPFIPGFKPISASTWLLNEYPFSVGESTRSGVYVKEDRAMKSNLGGIDLNPAQMNMQVKKEGEDFKFDFNGAEIDTAEVTGATFTIRQMTPVTNLPLLLGLTQESTEKVKV